MLLWKQWAPYCKMNLIIKNIGYCLTLNPSLGKGPLGGISNAAIGITGERINWIGPQNQIPKQFFDAQPLDAQGALVSPGLIDCHTHLLFGGQRADEFFQRLAGETYEEIGKKGGGISRTVSDTAKTSDQELLSLAKKRLDQFLSFGVTTVEVKSGYGLSLDREIRILRLISQLDHSIKIVPTFLGAHIVPFEFMNLREQYVNLICEEMLPQVVSQKLSGICDVFCDQGAFTLGEARKILLKAKELGLKVKLHADQLSSHGGAQLAAELGALSADHLEQVSGDGIYALSKASVIGVLIPGSVFSLGKRTYPPARRLIESGVKVAVSTDCNPGTSFSENLPLAMSLAAIELRMTIEEIWKAVTIHAALALDLSNVGTIEPNALADVVIWDAEHPEEVPYHYGSSFPKWVIKQGKPIKVGLGLPLSG